MSSPVLPIESDVGVAVPKGQPTSTLFNEESGGGFQQAVHRSAEALRQNEGGMPKDAQRNPIRSGRAGGKDNAPAGGVSGKSAVHSSVNSNPVLQETGISWLAALKNVSKTSDPSRGASSEIAHPEKQGDRGSGHHTAGSAAAGPDTSWLAAWVLQGSVSGHNPDAGNPTVQNLPAKAQSVSQAEVSGMVSSRDAKDLGSESREGSSGVAPVATSADEAVSTESQRTAVELSPHIASPTRTVLRGKNVKNVAESTVLYVDGTTPDMPTSFLLPNAPLTKSETAEGGHPSIEDPEKPMDGQRSRPESAQASVQSDTLVGTTSASILTAGPAFPGVAVTSALPPTAATTPNLPHAPVLTLNDPAWQQVVAAQVRQMTNGQVVVLQAHPDHLGPIQIRVQHGRTGDASGIQVQLEAAHTDTIRILQAAVPQLAQQLSSPQAGTAAVVTVSVSQQATDGGFSQNFQNPSGQSPQQEKAHRTLAPSSATAPADRMDATLSNTTSLERFESWI